MLQQQGQCKQQQQQQQDENMSELPRTHAWAGAFAKQRGTHHNAGLGKACGACTTKYSNIEEHMKQYSFNLTTKQL
jgi:hypothetical protein